jgi:hypothetical protein
MVWLDILLAAALLLIVLNGSALAATYWLDQSLLPALFRAGSAVQSRYGRSRILDAAVARSRARAGGRDPAQ